MSHTYRNTTQLLSSVNALAQSALNSWCEGSDAGHVLTRARLLQRDLARAIENLEAHCGD